MESFKREEILSVGIDIGTSTTQLIFSEIILENMASAFSIARIEIISKTILYKSEIYFTPLREDDSIDLDEVIKIIDKEFKLAKVDKEDIDIGAVIITGESARRANASEVLHKLSGYAGDFVVATAGATLESIISGKGAGSDKVSKEENLVVANIDVGGGTSNIVVFERGQTISSGCLDVGGRLVKLDKNNKITYINEKLKQIIKEENLPIEIGQQAQEESLSKLAKILVRQLETALGIKEKDQYYDMILSIDEIQIKKKVDAISFSGGVADIIYHDCDSKDIFKYQDMGIILGREIRNSELFTKFKVIEPEETIRATVVGAGSHTTDISGSTVTYDRTVLPLKNLPVLKIDLDDECDLLKVSEEVAKRIDWFKLENEYQNVAVSFVGLTAPTFKQIQICADQLITGLDELIENQFPIVIVIEKDIAKVLGQTINAKLNNGHPVVCVDSIEVHDGDYIDIGTPIAGGMVLPVAVKTLIFK